MRWGPFKKIEAAFALVVPDALVLPKRIIEQVSTPVLVSIIYKLGVFLLINKLEVKVFSPAIVWVPVVIMPLALLLALGIAPIEVVLPPNTKLAVGPAVVPLVQVHVPAAARLVAVVAVSALPFKLP